MLPTDVLLDAFEGHRPHVGRPSGNDRGTQYRSGIYWTNEADLPAIEALPLRQQARFIRAPSSPRVELRSTASTLEEYHQNYLEKNLGGYCHIDVRSADAFRRAHGTRGKARPAQVDGCAEPLSR